MDTMVHNNHNTEVKIHGIEYFCCMKYKLEQYIYE